MDGLPDIGALDTIVTTLGALVALASSGFTETALLYRRREMFHAISSNPQLPAAARDRAALRATEADLRIVAIAAAGSGPAAWLGVLFLAATSVWAFLSLGPEPPSAPLLALGVGFFFAGANLSRVRALSLDMHIAVLRGGDPRPTTNAALWRGLRRAMGATAVGALPAVLLSAEGRDEFSLDDLNLYVLAGICALLSIIITQRLDRRLQVARSLTDGDPAGTDAPDPT